MFSRYLKLALILFALPLLGACSQAGLVLLNGSVKSDYPQSITKDIAYGKKPWQRLDVYPNAALEQAPVIIFFYGGGWDSGKKSQYKFAAEAFVELGYTVVVPDYVKYPQGKFPSFVKDAAEAFSWTKRTIAKHHGDSNNIFIVGHSAGAHIGGLLTSDNRYLSEFRYSKTDIRGFAGLAGPYGFTPEEAKYRRIFEPESNFETMKAMNHIDGSESPMILLHGLGDKVVGVENKNALLAVLDDKNIANLGVDYKGVSHVGILLKLHPWFDGKIQPAKDIDRFFRPLIQSKD